MNKIPLIYFTLSLVIAVIAFLSYTHDVNYCTTWDFSQARCTSSIGIPKEAGWFVFSLALIILIISLCQALDYRLEKAKKVTLKS
jgi:hypothetical protein